MTIDSKRSLFVSGHQGFIGSHVVSHFQGRFGIKTFAGNLFEMPPSFLHGDEKVFFHFAGLSMPAACEKDAESAYKNNLLLTEELLAKFGKTLAANKTVFVFFSTAHVYETAEVALKEDALTNPKSVYSRTKYAAELLVKDLCTYHGIPFIIVRLFNTSHKSQVGPFFMPTLYSQFVEHAGEKEVFIPKLERVNVIRDFLALKDLLGAMEAIVRFDWSENLGSGTYNICSGHGKVLKDIVYELGKQMGISVALPNSASQIDSSIVGDSSKFQNMFSWQPSYSKSVADFVKSFLE